MVKWVVQLFNVNGIYVLGDPIQNRGMCLSNLKNSCLRLSFPPPPQRHCKKMGSLARFEQERDDHQRHKIEEYTRWKRKERQERNLRKISQSWISLVLHVASC